MNEKTKDLVCGVTGFREHKLKWGSDETHEDCKKLKILIKDDVKSLIDFGYSTFLTGMATGVDTYFAKIVLEYKEIYSNIELHAIVPYIGQEQRWKKSAQKEYNEIKSKCDKIVTLQQNYSDGCYLKRNDYIIDNSDTIIAVIDDINKLKSGSAYTARKALKQEKEVFIIDPVDLKIDEDSHMDFYKFEIDKLVKKLDDAVEQFGMADARTIELSEKVDCLINRYISVSK